MEPMLDPTAPATTWVLGGLLVLILAGLVANAIVRDRRDWERFARLRSSKRRRRAFRGWVLSSLAVFGGTSLVVLVLAGQFVPRFTDAARGLAPVAGVLGLVGEHPDAAAGFAIGIAIAVLAVLVLSVTLARGNPDIMTVGDIAAMMPRNRRELPWGAALSVNAGVVEELMFRLALPVLAYAVTGSAAIAVVGSIVLFGLLHVYQGVWGVLATMLIGAVLMAVFLVTGSILVPIVLHVLVDLRSLVLIPMVIGAAHRK